MRALRPEEEWARQMVSAALRDPVEQHDDGSRPGMHDLDILFPDGTRGAVEVTSAADGEAIALWNLMNGRPGRWIVADLAGGWMVTLDPAARAKAIRKHLPAVLRELEDAGIQHLDSSRSRSRGYFESAARQLGVVRAHQSGTSFPGSVYITLELALDRSGGFVADHSNAVAAWIGGFLAEDAQRAFSRSCPRPERWNVTPS